MTRPWRPGEAETAAARDDAEQRPCPECGAAPGAWCINRLTGQPYRGMPGHVKRMRETKD